MAYENNWEQSGVHRRYWGSTSDIEVMKSVGEGFSDSRFVDLRYVIYDFTDCDDVTYTSEGTELISALGVLSQMTNPNIKIAIVANKPSTRGLGESYSKVTFNQFPTEMFTTLNEARAWVAT
jgi:hypothetical protein